VIDHLFPETSLGELFDHELRWARTVRLVQPAGYVGSLIIHFWPLALIGAALAGFSPAALAALAGLTLFRLVQADAQTRMLGGERGLWPLIPLRDLVSLWVFLAALFGDKVVWRGARLQVRRDGAIATT
jgi:ceramide glucosyltransferase